jgi:hypothetical protein
MANRPHAGRSSRSSYTCEGCGEEYDPRKHDRGTATQDGRYCGLMCALEDADTPDQEVDDGE